MLSASEGAIYDTSFLLLVPAMTVTGRNTVDLAVWSI